MQQTADDLILALGLQAHPEGGYYVETHRDSGPLGTRGHGTAIYFLLRTSQFSHWHRIDATEIFHYYTGAPLEILQWTEGRTVERTVLGPNVLHGERPQVLIPPGVWQSARPVLSTDTEMAPDFSLVGCTVTPAFEFAGFELAAPNWSPP